MTCSGRESGLALKLCNSTFAKKHAVYNSCVIDEYAIDLWHQELRVVVVIGQLKSVLFRTLDRFFTLPASIAA